MRLRPLQSLMLALALFFVLAPHVACTAVGALIGTGIDAMYSHPRVIPAGEAATTRRGKRMVVTLRDGRRIATPRAWTVRHTRLYGFAGRTLSRERRA